MVTEAAALTDLPNPDIKDWKHGAGSDKVLSCSAGSWMDRPKYPDCHILDPTTPTGITRVYHPAPFNRKRLMSQIKVRLVLWTITYSPVNISRTASGCGPMFLGQSEAQHRISVLLLKRCSLILRHWFGVLTAQTR